MTENIENKSRALKIVLVGDGGTGKTSLVNQFVHKKFSSIYKTTIGVDITPYIVTEEKNPSNSIRFVLWDMSGQTHFERFRTKFYSGTSGAILVYDLTSASSYRNVERWIKELHEHCRKIPIIIAGNKADLDELQIMHNTPPVKGFPQVITSAKKNWNVDKTFLSLFETIVKKKLIKHKEQELKTTHVSYKPDD
ncbi:MAG: GTP-binding protein [Candidatus Hodarchaeales archaeon]